MQALRAASKVQRQKSDLVSTIHRAKVRNIQRAATAKRNMSLIDEFARESNH